MNTPTFDFETLRQAWRLFFAGFLVLALGIGLYLSFQPAQFDDDDQIVEGTTPTEDSTADGNGDGGDGDTEDEPEETATDSEQEEGLTEEEAEALIAAARDPEETSVQVLDAGGGSDATTDVADALGELGYDVVAINSSRTDYSVTTVLFTDGNEAEAAALNARDERFAETAPNERLSEDVDLHVVVGPDWE